MDTHQIGAYLSRLNALTQGVRAEICAINRRHPSEGWDPAPR
jgi:hypothetical protein